MKSVSGRIFFTLLITLVITLFTATSLSSHHATATEYDISKTIVLKGTISRVDWTNPHVHVRLNVKSKEGVSEDWDVEFGSLGAMAVAGIARDVMKPGGAITVKGYPGKQTEAAKARRACAVEATLPDGLTVTFVVGI